MEQNYMPFYNNLPEIEAVQNFAFCFNNNAQNPYDVHQLLLD
jgi:hypothetical protein